MRAYKAKMAKKPRHKMLTKFTPDRYVYEERKHQEFKYFNAFKKKEKKTDEKDTRRKKQPGDVAVGFDDFEWVQDHTDLLE